MAYSPDLDVALTGAPSVETAVDKIVQAGRENFPLTLSSSSLSATNSSGSSTGMLLSRRAGMHKRSQTMTQRRERPTGRQEQLYVEYSRGKSSVPIHTDGLCRVQTTVAE